MALTQKFLEDLRFDCHPFIVPPPILKGGEGPSLSGEHASESEAPARWLIVWEPWELCLSLCWGQGVVRWSGCCAHPAGGRLAWGVGGLSEWLAEPPHPPTV